MDKASPELHLGEDAGRFGILFAIRAGAALMGTAARAELAHTRAMLEEAHSARTQAQAACNAATASAAEEPVVRMVAERRADIESIAVDNPQAREILQRLVAIEGDIEAIRPAGQTEAQRRARTELDRANRRVEAIGARFQELYCAAAEEAAEEAIERVYVQQVAEATRTMGVLAALAAEVAARGLGDSPLPAAHETARRIQRKIREAREGVEVRPDRDAAQRFLARLAVDPMAELEMPSGPVMFDRVPVAGLGDRPIEDGRRHLNFGSPVEAAGEPNMPNPYRGPSGEIPAPVAPITGSIDAGDEGSLF